MGIVSSVKRIGFSILGFVSTPSVGLNRERDLAFDKLIEGVLEDNAETIDYDLPYPKYEFLPYLSKSDRYLMHGSPNQDIEIFHPRLQTTFYGRHVESVFATCDGIWSMFFAILDRRILSQYRNGCFSVDKDAKLANWYFFSIPKGMLEKSPWVDGFVYLLPKTGFRQSDTPNEWICSNPVVPVTKLAVTPTDFPFLAYVTEFNPTSSMLKFFVTNAIRAHTTNRQLRQPPA